MAEQTTTKRSEASLRHKASFINGIIKENPLLVSLLGLCPALAVTTTLEGAIGMGFLFTFVLVCSNVIISLLRKIIPDEAKTPCEIVVIAAFVTIVKMLTNAFLPELYTTLGVFISLLVVNCIVLGRAEAFATKNGVLDSLLDGIGNGIGYALAICLVGIIREILGTGMLTFGTVFTFIPKTQLPILTCPTDWYMGGNLIANHAVYDFSLSLFAKSAGGFFVIGIVLAVMNLHALRKKKKEAAAKTASMKAAVKPAAKPVAKPVAPAASQEAVKAPNATEKGDK